MKKNNAAKDFFTKLVKKDTPETNLLKDLYLKPKENKGINKVHFQTPLEEGIIQQMDLLYLPNDNGNKYALVIVDVSDRKIAAEPLKNRAASDVLAAIKKVYTSKRLPIPNIMSVDGGAEFKGVVEKYFTQNKVSMKIAVPFRHKQQCFVEHANLHIGSLIHKYQTNQELITGSPHVAWTDVLQTIVEVLNEATANVKERENKLKMKAVKALPGKSGKELDKEMVKFTNDMINNKKMPVIKDGVSRAEGDAANIYDEGELVRVKLEAPMDNVTGKPLHGNFRSSDVRWEKQPSTVDLVVLNPKAPPQYKVSGHPFAIYNKAELQKVKPNETMDISLIKKSDTFLVEKILDKKIVKKQIFYKIKWKYLPDSSSTWESKKSLYEGGVGVQKLIEKYEANQ